MQFGPVENELLSATGQVPSDDGQRLYGNDRFELRVLNMEVGGTMVIEKHVDEHSVKCAYRGQADSLHVLATYYIFWQEHPTI